MSITLDLKHQAPPAETPDAPINLAGLSREALRAALVGSGVVAPDKARMRASQL